MDGYFATGSGTNTANTSVLYVAQPASPTRRPRVFDWWIGSAATPADQAADMTLRRISDEATTPAGTAFTPQLMDPASPAAAMSTAIVVAGSQPTKTANALPARIPLNQRATQRWVAVPRHEIVIPATEDNGLTCEAASVTSAFTISTSIYWYE